MFQTNSIKSTRHNHKPTESFVQNEQHKCSQRTRTPTTNDHFQLHDRVWVRLFDKHSQNPKRDPTFEPGIIVDKKSASTFRANRLERSRKKTITLNHTLFKKRHSEHPMDTRLIPARHYKPAFIAQNKASQEDIKSEHNPPGQQGPITRARAKCSQDNVKEAFVHAVNTMACLLYTSPSPRDRG